MHKRLLGKVAIITGASHGLGREIAKQYILAGANVMLCGRDNHSLEAVKTHLLTFTTPSQQVLSTPTDVSKESDVEKVVNDTLSFLGGCHILVNNAGIYGPKGEIEATDWDEWTRTIEINVYGSILMCRQLLPHFKKQGYGKIIQLSGGGATQPMPLISAYAVSKAAIVRFTETLAQEVKEYGISVNAIAPGALNTRMLDEILDAGPEKVGEAVYQRCLIQKSSGGAPMSKATDLALFLASDASDGITGKLISALWDDWQEWPNHLEALSASDAYTLRRIVGKDRGLDWGDL